MRGAVCRAGSPVQIVTVGCGFLRSLAAGQGTTPSTFARRRQPALRAASSIRGDHGLAAVSELGAKGGAGGGQLGRGFINAQPEPD